MRKFIHGTDSGHAVMTALILVIVLSSLLISLISHIYAAKQYARKYREKEIQAIEKSNMELRIQYDIH